VALSKNASRTRYTIKIKLKLRKWVLKKKSFQLPMADHPQMRACSYAWSLSVTWQRWRSHHSICHSRKPHAKRKLRGCFIERELFPMEVLHCGNMNFRPFSLLWLWTWPDNLHMRTWPISPGDIPDVQIWTSYVKAFESHRLTDRQTRPKLYTTPLRGWSIIMFSGVVIKFYSVHI